MKKTTNRLLLIIILLFVIVQLNKTPSTTQSNLREDAPLIITTSSGGGGGGGGAKEACATSGDSGSCDGVIIKSELDTVGNDWTEQPANDNLRTDLGNAADNWIDNGGPQSAPLHQTQDFRNTYGGVWYGTACDNLAYAKSMGYDYIMHSSGMGSCPASDRENMHFYVGGGPEQGARNIYLDTTKTYTSTQISTYNSIYAWKGNATESTLFPWNLATGWWTTNISFRPLLDIQQQKIIDEQVQYELNQIMGLEDNSIGWKFGGWSWDVPELRGDWWTERQGGYTGTNWSCNGVPCKGKSVNISYWNPLKLDSSALHTGITHEYPTYTDGMAAYDKILFNRTRTLYPDMKIWYEPYDMLSHLRSIQGRNDILELMPPYQVFYTQESGDSPSNDIKFVTDPNIFSSGIITKAYVGSSTPDTHDVTRNLRIAGYSGINGAWMSWFGRLGGTDGTTNYAVRDLPNRLKLIRVVPNWDNLHDVPLSDRSWDETNLKYSSTNSYADLHIIYSRHPKNNNIYAVFVDGTAQSITLHADETFVAAYTIDQLFRKSTLVSSDFTVQGKVLTPAKTITADTGYIIEVSHS